MSKRDLKKYLQELDKSQLEEQIIELYERFNPIKVYYDFVFNPKEDTLLKEAKIKISNEYFPPAAASGKPRRPKMRRSVAQKYIKHFLLLGVDPYIITDVMLFAIEIGQTFSAEKPVKAESFYKSMLNSFEQAVRFMITQGILEDFKPRLEAINQESFRQNWFNKSEYEAIIERFEY
jgi:hypothetical protein